MITCIHLCIIITASCTIKRCHCWWSLQCVEEWLKSLKSEAVFSTLMCVRRSRCRFCGLSQFTALKVYSHLQSVSPKLLFSSSPTWIFCSNQASLQTLLDMPCSFPASAVTHIVSSSLLSSLALLQDPSGSSPDFSVKLSTTLAFLHLFWHF